MDSLHTHQTEHPILNLVLGIIATISGAAGMNLEALTMADLQYYDIVLALILKGVSIVSFLVLIILNIGKLSAKIKTWFSSKK